MQVFKFGGASVKDATSVRNVAQILKKYEQEDLVIVVSAMGKMTNAFEKLVQAYLKTEDDFKKQLTHIRDYHFAIVKELFLDRAEITSILETYFAGISHFFIRNKSDDYDYIYDQIVGYGELLSTKIISYYLHAQNWDHTWLNAHELIITDNTHRSAVVDWKATESQIMKKVKSGHKYLTQGFIAYSDNVYTTLGREGSDYTTAIFSYILDADRMSIWKDVPGVLNADPRYFKETILLEKISYREALEMAFYGATVIHPKTIKPLENKNIELHVKSFVNPDAPGTIVSKGVDIFPKTTCYTYKENQILLSIATKDFSFMIEHNISQLFQLFADYKIKVNLIQNTATSFWVCIEDIYHQVDKLIEELSQDYELQYFKEVKLITLRHFSKEILEKFTLENKLLLIQQNGDIAQLIVK